jgi:hypothetical protein
VQYHWRDNSWERGNPQDIGEHLEYLYQKNGNQLTSEIIVRDAARANSPLHDLFDWDDASAAEKYRTTRVNGILGTLMTSHRGDDVRAFLGFGKRNEGVTFRPLERVLKSRRMREEQIHRELRRLDRWKTRTAFLPELQKARKAIEDALDAAGFVVGV